MTETTNKRTYTFGDGTADGHGGMKALLGGKGANLAEMARIGLPVPPGFTIGTDVCLEFQELGGLPPDLMGHVRETMGWLEKVTGKKFGDPNNPLLVSVRSGAMISMPGMMDTVLNLGLNPEVRDGMEKTGGSPRFTRDSHRRLIQMFSNVVDGVPGDRFEEVLHEVKKAKGAELDVELDAAAWDDVINGFLDVYVDFIGTAFPTDPWEQLERAISAVFRSWDTPRARTYRRLNNISDDLGTAVNVQTMVFGNLGEDCSTGVGFTRDPSTGEDKFYGEFLPNAQGEDVVAGIRTPLPVREERAEAFGLKSQSLESMFPEAFKDLMDVADKLESHYKEVQDLEFTVEHGTFYILQTRTAKRTGHAWVKNQVDMVNEGLIEPVDAVKRVPPDALSQLLAPVLAPASAAEARSEGRVIATGLNAGPGAAAGKIAFDADEAEERVANGEKVVLVRDETTPDDIHGMHAAEGILTARGGMTSHAAVVARGMGKPAVVGCKELNIDSKAQTLTVGGKTYGTDDVITLDGSVGEVFSGSVTIMPSEVVQVTVDNSLDPEEAPLYQAFDKLMVWADEFRRLGVRTNADTPKDSSVAIALGAQGIGLCRTEHMFFEADRILAMRKMILADTVEDRQAALAEIEPMQAADFAQIFVVMKGKPVTIRTLDPPLHEFLPHTDEEISELAEAVGKDPAAVKARVSKLRESNPMLGHRGCRLGIAYPEITRMQARAIIGAALNVASQGFDVRPEIMIPLVGHAKELELQRELVLEEAEALFEKAGSRVDFLVGTMIEIPRAALTAGEVADLAQFFSFGTNDLTQMTMGISRDDAGGFLPDYVARRIYAVDPFVSIDQTGVGRLVKLALEEGRAVKGDLKVGICGEHGGDPASVVFCHEVGLDYVSCSPYRVPIARLAAAQAALAEEDGN